MVEAQLNFFLIGAPKSGTTTIHERLSSHPEVFLSPIKEPNHFATDIDVDGFSPAFRANTPLDLASYFTERPLAPRQIGFVQDPVQFAQLFAGAGPGHKVVGECSTSYLWSTEAARNVARAHPGAHILVVLRNPVDRLHSHWLMARKYGFTSQSLREAVERDRHHPNPGWGRSELFIEAGLYARPLQRWLDVFPRERMRVLFTEDLAREETWTGLAAWLGIGTPIPGSSRDKANEAGLARWEGVNRMLTVTGAKRRMADLLPDRWKERVRRRWYSSEGMPKLSEEDRKALYGHFAHDVQELERMLSVDLSHWRP